MLGLQDELSITFTEQQKEDLLAGLSQPNWLPDITTRTHPLLAERNRVWIKDRVRRYLTHGPADPASRTRSLQALERSIHDAKLRLLEKFPNDAQVVNEATRRALKNIEANAANPLRVDYATNSEPQLVAEATARTGQYVESLDLSDVDEPDERMTYYYFLIARATSQLAHRNASAVTPSEEYAELDARIDSMSSELAEWHASARSREVAARETDRFVQSLLDEDQVGKVVDDRLESLAIRPSLGAEGSDQGRPAIGPAPGAPAENDPIGQTEGRAGGSRKIGWSGYAAMVIGLAAIASVVVLAWKRRSSPS